jgi:hypothetical protein
LLFFVVSETVSFETTSAAEQGAETAGTQLLFLGGTFGGNTSNRNISSDTMFKVFLLNVDKSNGGATAVAVVGVEAPRAIATFHRLGHASLAFNVEPGFSRHPVSFTLTSTDMIGDKLVDLAPVPAPLRRPPTPRPSSSNCC